jgi:hypothetical protein
MSSKIAFTKALIQARSQFGELSKDKKGHFEYASITAIKKAIEKPLADNGFSYHFETTVEERPVLWLVVEHDEGERKMSGYPLFNATNDRKDPNQQFGSSLSYGMRNLLRTFFCLDADDNDADNYDPETGEARVPQKRYVANANNKASEKQVAFIARLVREKNKDLQAILDYYKVTSLSELNSQQASEVIERLNK